MKDFLNAATLACDIAIAILDIILIVTILKRWHTKDGSAA